MLVPLYQFIDIDLLIGYPTLTPLPSPLAFSLASSHISLGLSLENQLRYALNPNKFALIEENILYGGLIGLLIPFTFSHDSD
jgi:hypothetical protein